jgi:hypothetical protein
MNTRWSPVGWIVAAALLAGCGKPASPVSQDDTGVSESPAPKPNSAEPPSDFALSAETFAEEVRDGPAAAAKKYDKRVVELWGKVVSFARHPLDPSGRPSIRLASRDPQFPVVCETVDKSPWTKCTLGNTVRLRGTVNGPLLFGAARMFDCELAAVSGAPAMAVAVDQLLKDIAADKDAAEKKYDGKVILLSGEFVSDDELKGDAKWSIIFMTAFDDPLLKKLKGGERVTFLGELRFIRIESADRKQTDDQLYLIDAILTQASVLPK